MTRCRRADDLGQQAEHRAQRFGGADLYAAPTLSATTLNFGSARIGGSLATQTLKIGNGAAADAFQESLTYALGVLPVGFKDQSGTTGTVASGVCGSAILAIAADKAGDFSGGTTTLALTSTGVGTSGLADTNLASQTIRLNGKVYAPAVHSSARRRSILAWCMSAIWSTSALASPIQPRER